MEEEKISKPWVACGICFGSGWRHLEYQTDMEKEKYAHGVCTSVVACKCPNGFGLAKFTEGINNVAEHHRDSIRGSGYTPKEIVY